MLHTEYNGPVLGCSLDNFWEFSNFPVAVNYRECTAKTPIMQSGKFITRPSDLQFVVSSPVVAKQDLVS